MLYKHPISTLVKCFNNLKAPKIDTPEGTREGVGIPRNYSLQNNLVPSLFHNQTPPHLPTCAFGESLETIHPHQIKI